MSTSERTQRSRSQWQTVIDQQQGSGQSVPAFCASHGIAYSTFMSWRKKLSGSVQTKPTRPAKRTPFIEIPMQASSCWDIKLQLGELVLRLKGR